MDVLFLLAKVFWWFWRSSLWQTMQMAGISRFSLNCNNDTMFFCLEFPCVKDVFALGLSLRQIKGVQPSVCSTSFAAELFLCSTLNLL